MKFKWMVTFCCVTLGLAEAVKSLSYHDSTISFEAPAGWESKSYKGAKAVFAAPEVVENFRPNLNLVVTPLKQKVRMPEIKREMQQVVKTHKARLVAARETTLGGAPAYDVVAEQLQGRTMVRVEQVMAVYNNKLYALTMMAPMQQASKYTPLFQKVFQSVRFIR